MLKKLLTTLSTTCLLTIGVANTAHSFNMGSIFGSGNFTIAGNSNATIVEPDDVKIVHYQGNAFINHLGEDTMQYKINFHNESNNIIVGIEAIDFMAIVGRRVKRISVNARFPRPLKPNQDKEITISLDGKPDAYGDPIKIIPIYAE